MLHCLLKMLENMQRLDRQWLGAAEDSGDQFPVPGAHAIAIRRGIVMGVPDQQVVWRFAPRGAQGSPMQQWAVR